MKKSILTFFAVLTVVGAFAQSPFFCTKVGTTLVFSQKNGKGEIRSYSKQIVTDVDSAGNDITVTYSTQALDKKQVPLKKSNPVELKTQIKDNVVMLNMGEMIAKAASSNVPSSMHLQASGTPLEIPANLEPAEAIKDPSINLSFKIFTKTITSTVDMKNGKCESVEDITVPAGTFKCHKITQDYVTTVSDNTSTTKSISWYAVGIGPIKTEVYDAKGKLMNLTEMVSIK